MSTANGRTLKQEISDIREHLKAMERRMESTEGQIVVAYVREAWTCLGEGIEKLKSSKLVLLLAFAVLTSFLVSTPAQAYDRSMNPDRFASVGLDVSSGHLAGVLKDVPAGSPATDGGFVKGMLDVRVPISNAITVHGFGSTTGVNNNLQFSEGSEVGIGLRIYLQ